MAMKSDFAQKLLTDLRRRKEQIAVAGNSGNTNSKSRDTIITRKFASCNIMGFRKGRIADHFESIMHMEDQPKLSEALDKPKH
ncbi:hypothetical protein Leryth_013406 [Lithospermum erythrorhizon]|nr:hypothetical protein Leryth_013406 [Lithospermum erythrorhizon]